MWLSPEISLSGMAGSSVPLRFLNSSYDRHPGEATEMVPASCSPDMHLAAYDVAEAAARDSRVWRDFIVPEVCRGLSPAFPLLRRSNSAARRVKFRCSAAGEFPCACLQNQ